MNWTDEQREAINFRNGSAIVSAAAGSGKTAVLVERVKRILTDEENPVNADELVIVTFTEKAAGELKTRLNNALTAAVKENPHSEYLKNQLLRLEDASVSTISAFCMKLLRGNSAAAGLSPDFSVLDEADGRVMYDKSLEAVMEDFYENGNQAGRELVYDWYGGENDGELLSNITYIYSFLRTVPDVEKALSLWSMLYENPEENAPKYQILQLRKLSSRYITGMKKILSGAYAENEKCEELLKKWRNLVGIMEEAAKNADLHSALSAAAAEVPTCPRKTKDFDSTYIKGINDSLKDDWKKLAAEINYSVRFTDDVKKSAPVFRIITDLAKRTDDEFTKRKRLRNKVDFADMEILALKLLRDEKTAGDIRKSISVIIVDEFQDSNDMQYEIFSALSRNKSNLFFVGDIKQSIYRFRGANPLVFSRILEDSDFTPIYLNKNFRSNSAVIDSVNGIFEGTMTKELGEVDYDDNAKLVQGAEYTVSDEHKTELIRIFGEKMTDAREKEAAYIAQRIKAMVNSGFMVKNKDDTYRPCCYGDFAVLMGKYRTSAFIYKKAFRKAGIPYEAKDDGAFTDLFEIKLMMSLLKIIDNPYHNVALAAVLTLPPYCFTAEELAKIKLCGGESHKKLYSGLLKYASENEKAADFLKEFRELREFSEEHSVEQLIRKIYDESDVVTAILAMPDGDKRDSNLKLLLSYAARFSDGGTRSLYDFTEYMETVSNSDVKLACAHGAEYSENSVKLMTIHGSKGLEFPVCIVANLSSAVRPSRVSKIVADIDYGIGMQVVYNKKGLVTNTLLHSLIKRLSEGQEQSESMRLLYVAATRAREKLIFTAPVTSDEGHKSHLKWIMESRAVKTGLINVNNLYDYEPTEESGKEEGSAKEIIVKPFTEYKYKEYSAIPAKVTATQVGVKSVDDYAEKSSGMNRFLRMPSFTKGDEPKKLSGKKKGDAYHKAMELMDFSGSAGQLDSLYERGKLSAAERNSISDEEITEFLESGLCERINRSGTVHKEFPIFCEHIPENFPDDEEKPFVQGIADLFFEEDDGIVLVDYKTNVGQNEEQLIEEYSGQLQVYANAISRMTGKRVKECYLWSFTLRKEIKVIL